MATLLFNLSVATSLTVVRGGDEPTQPTWRQPTEEMNPTHSVHGTARKD